MKVKKSFLQENKYLLLLASIVQYSFKHKHSNYCFENDMCILNNIFTLAIGTFKFCIELDWMYFKSPLKRFFISLFFYYRNNQE